MSKPVNNTEAAGGTEPQSLLQKNNGNYIAALMDYIDGLDAPVWMRKSLRVFVLTVIVATVLCMLVWPFVIRLTR